MEFEKQGIEELLSDESFVNYCKKSSTADIQKWEAFLLENPGQKPIIDAAVYELNSIFNILSAQDLAEQESDLLSKLGQSASAPVVQMPLTEEKRTRRFIPLFIKIASVAAVVFLIFFFKDRLPGLKAEESMKSFTSANGERKTLQLPDGSGVTLNGGSKISIPGNYGSTSRDIYLEGEAFFDVKHNKELPFIVHTPAMDIKAVGTAFNVKAYPCEKTTEASLISGLVEVTLKEQENRKMLLNKKKKVQWLEPTATSQQLTAQETHNNNEVRVITPVQNLTKTESGIIKEVAWTENKLAFYDESFDDIALLLERWYGAKIEFLDNDIRTYRFSGEYEKEELGTILGFLKESKHFNYDIIRGSALTVKLYK